MAWFFGNKQQKYIENLEKNNKKRQEKEREEAEIITIGKATPEQQEERASQVVAQRNQKRMEARGIVYPLTPITIVFPW